MSVDIIIKPDTSVCEGCLSTDRCVAPLGKYLELYRKIWCVLNEGVYETKFIDPVMCWECLKMFRNIYHFYHRVKQAQEILEDNVNSINLQTQLPSLSNLTSVINVDNYHEYKSNRTDSYIIKDNTEETDLCHKLENEDVDDVEQKPPASLKEEANDNPEETDVCVKFENKDVHDVEQKSPASLKEAEVQENLEDFDQDGVDSVIEYEGPTQILTPQVQKRDEYQPQKYKYVSLSSDLGGKHKYSYEQVKINYEELLQWLDKQKNLRNYKKMAFKCDTCILGYPSADGLKKHEKEKHDLIRGKYICDICKTRLSTKSLMVTHCSNHFKKYVCLLCKHQCFKRWQMYYHYTYWHGKEAMECLQCGLRFKLRRDFYDHYKNIHEKYVCDYCGKKTLKKRLLIRHIRYHHTTHICKECNTTFKGYFNLQRHTNMKHVKEATEESYCVECNIQFDNELLYRIHLKGNIRHTPRKKSFACPECDKVYAKKCTMHNHYKYVHLKQTNHYCSKCSKYFLNGFRLRQHTASVHDKIPLPKNKFCKYCGRGFSSNRILNNHVRTHTGERPYRCDHCSAAFGQKQALVTHTRTIHDKSKNK